MLIMKKSIFDAGPERKVMLELDRIGALFATCSDWEDLSRPKTPLLLTFKNQNTCNYTWLSTSGLDFQMKRSVPSYFRSHTAKDCGAFLEGIQVNVDRGHNKAAGGRGH